VAKNHNFGQILTFCGLLYRPPFTDVGQIWCAKADPRFALTCQISSECVNCVGFRWPKIHNLGQILTFWGFLYRPPFTAECQIWYAIADARYTLKLTCQISPRLVYSVALCWRKTLNFCHFYTSAFCVVAKWQQFDKVEHGCTATNLPLSNGIKIVSVLQRLHGEIGRTISDVQKCDEETNRQTKRLNVFGHPGGG